LTGTLCAEAAGQFREIAIVVGICFRPEPAVRERVSVHAQGAGPHNIACESVMPVRKRSASEAYDVCTEIYRARRAIRLMWQMITDVDVGQGQYVDGQWRIVSDGSGTMMKVRTNTASGAVLLAPTADPNSYEEIARDMIVRLRSVRQAGA
jgi:hypothetical protein